MKAGVVHNDFQSFRGHMDDGAPIESAAALTSPYASGRPVMYIGLWFGKSPVRDWSAAMAGDPSSSRLRRIAARAMLVGMGLLVGTLLAEGVARVVGPPLPGFVLDATMTVYEPRLYARHPTRITTLAPNVDVTLRAIEYETRVRTDRLGLRGSPAPDGDLRVAFIGDSFTLGVQVDEADTFAEQTAARVAARTGRRVVPLNAGVDGYGVTQAVDRLDELLRSTRLSHVVLTVYLGNDLRDDARLEEKRAAMNRPPPIEDEAGFDSLDTMQRKSAMARLSRLYAWISVVRALRARTDDFRIQEYADELKVFTDPAVLAAQLPSTARGLERLGATCRARRLRCVVALAPPAWVVHPARMTGTFEALGVDPSAIDVTRLVDGVRSSVPPGIEVVDLTEPLQKAAPDGALYFTFDPHWTARGHHRVAEVLEAAIP